MTNAWFLGATDSVPQTENEVRDTRDILRSDGGDPAELAAAPDFNEFDSDESGELTGLSPRMVGGHTVDSVKPHPWWAGMATENHNAIIDNQVASSGTAAQREMAGQAGHGTMQYAESLEPEIRDAARFGSEYFKSNEAVIQEGMGDYMAPTQTDNWNNAVAQRAATDNAARATQASLFSAFLGG